MFGSKDPQEVNTMAKQAGEVFNYFYSFFFFLRFVWLDFMHKFWLFWDCLIDLEKCCCLIIIVDICVKWRNNREFLQFIFQFINIVMNLMDALKTSFSHRSLAARSLGKKDSMSDASVASISWVLCYNYNNKETVNFAVWHYWYV